MIRYLFPLVSLLALASVARGAAGWTLTTADFHSQGVTLNSIDALGVHVTTSTAEVKVIAFEQFLDIGRPLLVTQPGGRFVLYFASGDLIGGEPVGIKGNDLVWNHPALGEISLPMKKLAGMSRPGLHPLDARRKEDVITLANGDTLRGIIADFAAGKVTVQTEAGSSEVPIASVNQINFAVAPGVVVPVNGFRVRLDDGSAIIATSIKVADEKIEVVLGKDSIHSMDLARVASIEQVNGPVSWLSSRPMSENLYVPFIGTPHTGAAKMDHNWTGADPIRFGSQQFAHGIGVHSYSRLSWDLDGTFEAFRTRYAIDTQEANTRADVTVRILLDGKPAYEQVHVRAGTLSPVIIEDLKGAKKLTLEVDYGDNMDTQDRMNWIEPALLKHKPAD